MSRKSFVSIVTISLLIPSYSWSAEKESMQEKEMQQERLQEHERLNETLEERSRLRDTDRIYGWQLMSPAERQAYRQKIRRLKTHAEREAYRKQHHERMQKRAEEKGAELQTIPE